MKNSLKIVNPVNSHNKCQGIYSERCTGRSLKRQIEIKGKERSSEDLKYLIQEVMFGSTTEPQKELLRLIFYALSNLLGDIFCKSFVDGKKEEIMICIKNYTNPDEVLEGDGLVDINTSNKIGLNAIHPVCKDGHKHIHVDKPAKESDDHNDVDSKTLSDLRGADFIHTNRDCFHCHDSNGKEVDSGDPSYLTSNSSSLELDLETAGPNTCHVIQTLAMSNAKDFFNLESLESIAAYPGIHEGKPSYLRRIQIGKGSSLMASVEDVKKLECVANQEGEKECLKRATDDHEFQPGKEQTIQNIIKEKLKKGLSGLRTITRINKARMWLEKCSWFRTEDSTLRGKDQKQNEVIVETANKMKLSMVSPQSSSSSFLLSSSLSSMSILNYLSIFRFHSRMTDEETSGEVVDRGDPVDPEGDPVDPEGDPVDPEGDPVDPEGDPVDDEGDPVDPPIPIPQVIPDVEWDGHPVDPIGEAEGDGGDDPVDPAGNQVVIG